MDKTFRIAPSILSANFAKLGQEIDDVITSGTDLVHFDVMDNHYVPNLTIGPLVCEAIRETAARVGGIIDVHLMVSPVDALAAAFAQAGADLISFHPDASDHVHRSIQAIKSHGVKAGLVFNPAEPLDVLEWTIDDIDLILIMSVNPGFGGQSFMENMMDKVRRTREMIGDRPIWLQVDGGISMKTIEIALDAGADTFVVGSAVFNAPDPAAMVVSLREFAIARENK